MPRSSKEPAVSKLAVVVPSSVIKFVWTCHLALSWTAAHSDDWGKLYLVFSSLEEQQHFEDILRRSNLESAVSYEPVVVRAWQPERYAMTVPVTGKKLGGLLRGGR